MVSAPRGAARKASKPESLEKGQGVGGTAGHVAAGQEPGLLFPARTHVFKVFVLRKYRRAMSSRGKSPQLTLCSVPSGSVPLNFLSKTCFYSIIVTRTLVAPVPPAAFFFSQEFSAESVLKLLLQVWSANCEPCATQACTLKLRFDLTARSLLCTVEAEAGPLKCTAGTQPWRQPGARPFPPGLFP